MGFVQRNYNYHQVERGQHVRGVLPDMVTDHLANTYDKPVKWWAAFDKMNHRVLLDRIETPPDLFVHCGVGPRPHSEAEQLRARWQTVPIIGFEPDRDTYADRATDYPGTLHPWAVGPTVGKITIYPGATDPGMTRAHQAVDGYAIDCSQNFGVSVVRIDDVAPACLSAFLGLISKGPNLKLCAVQNVPYATRGGSTSKSLNAPAESVNPLLLNLKFFCMRSTSKRSTARLKEK